MFISGGARTFELRLDCIYLWMDGLSMQHGFFWEVKKGGFGGCLRFFRRRGCLLLLLLIVEGWSVARLGDVIVL